MTTCLMESVYHLERALLTRGLTVSAVDLRSFHAENDFTAFTLTFMPGNRRILISSKVVVFEKYRGKGWGACGLAMREEVAKESGCNLMLATVRNDNVIENHLLSKHGWKKMLDRTETQVTLWGKEL